MLLRLRGPDGMKRITIDQNDTFAELGRQVSPNEGDAASDAGEGEVS